MRRAIIGGNWKMQVTTVEKSVTIAKSLVDETNHLNGLENVEIFICPSYNALNEVSKIVNGTNIKLGAQNVSAYSSGAFTGEISVESLIEADVEYVLLGHSERRRIMNEKDDFINQKVHLCLQNGLKVVLCIGETAKEREAGLVEKINREQLKNCLKDVKIDDLENIIIAYEPVWAINNKFLNPDTEIKAASNEEAEGAHKIVRNWFKENYNTKSAEKIRIQYGGSMNSSNVDQLLSLDDIDGGLIGSASLSSEKFLPIIKSTIEKKK